MAEDLAEWLEILAFLLRFDWRDLGRQLWHQAVERVDFLVDVSISLFPIGNNLVIEAQECQKVPVRESFE